MNWANPPFFNFFMTAQAAPTPNLWDNQGPGFWAILVVFFMVIAIAMFIMEVFFIPGIGIAALVGVVCFSTSILICFFKFDIYISASFFIFSSIIVSIFGYWVIFIFPHTALSNGLIHKSSPGKSKALEQQLAANQALMGQEGEVIVECRPIGKAKFGNQKVEVLAEGQLLSKGTKVKVIGLKDNQILVESLP